MKRKKLIPKKQGVKFQPRRLRMKLRRKRYNHQKKEKEDREEKKDRKETNPRDSVLRQQMLLTT